jgi:glycerophosphoryl diester phosphodiesterase
MFVYGHRGASHDFPENTLEAFRAAAEQGADGVELDVRRTLDGGLVVHHDPDLPDGRRLSQIASAERPASVPTLRAALEACGGMTVNVEIKHGDDPAAFDDDRRVADQTLECWSSLAAPPPILVSSFDLEVIERVKRVDASVPTGYLVLGVDDPDDAIARCVDGGHQAVHPWDPMVDPDVVGRARAAGIDVNVWTVDDPERMVALAGWGVTGVVTNRPGLARTALEHVVAAPPSPPSRAQ